MKLTDFHTHTFLSDGVLPPAEQIRRFIVNGFYAMAITDHVDSSNIDFILNSLINLQEDFRDEIIFIPGVEITHVPPYRIPILAKKAKERNCLVVVHGETIVEPVAEGTNLAAVSCPDVDILAHPGNLSFEEAEAAKKNDVFLEITTRGGHDLGNGRVARFALEAGAKLIVNSDFHAPRDFLTMKKAKETARGAGIPEEYFEQLFETHPKELISRFK